MTAVRETIRMYFKLISISFRGRMQFRTDFIIGVVAVIVLNLFSLATIGVVISRFQSLAGWTLWEIVFLYGLWILGHSVFSLLFWHIEDLEDFLIRGTFDMFLVRPISPFLQLLAHEINYPGIADVLVGIACLVISVSNLHLHWNALHIGFLALVVLSGTLIEFSITLALACVAFWTGRSSNSINTMMQFSFLIQRYPVDMFGRWFRVFVTALIPVAFMNYYPALLLLGKRTPGDPWAWLSFASPVVALLLMAVAALVWRVAIRQYSSAGG